VIDCADRRSTVRAIARDRIEQERAIRRAERDQYRAGRMTAEENDSLAEHSIAREHLELWRETRHRFAYDLPPDHRAELFGEWLEEHPTESVRLLAERAESIDWDERAADYYGQEVPF
jgi:hypothetical protein